MNRDRAEIAKRALRKGRYLSLEQEKEEAIWAEEQFKEVVSGLLADLLHLGAIHGIRVNSKEDVERICAGAWGAYVSDLGMHG